MKVAIVDDEWYGLDVTYRLLTQVRNDLELVAFFQDPVEALEKIPHLNPELVILDVEMPHINGIEMYEKLRRPDICFMMITAHGATALNGLLHAQNVGILSKPFCKADIVSILQAMPFVKHNTHMP